MRAETAVTATLGEARALPAELRARPRGMLVVPFVAASGVVLLLALALQRAADPAWVLGAIGTGLVAASFSFAWTLRRTRQHALVAAPPAAADPGETDPLASVKVVEEQGRRHRKPCPNCGTPVGSDREKCPSCGHMILLDCKGCRTRVRLEWGMCPECGRELP